MSDLQGPGFVREASRSISGGIRRSDDNLVDGRRYLWRSRWAAIGAAVAVTFGGGGLFVANAASSAPSSVVSIDPVRILDTRDPVNIGLPGPFVSAASQKLQVTGSVVPSGATGVLLNVTVTAPSANGFLSIRPGDATGAASTSSLNFNAGQTVPNSVQVALPTAGANAGQIDITYDAFGASGPTTDILIDVVGYTNSSRLDALQAGIDGVQAANAAQQTQIDAKANSVDVYTKAQVDTAIAGRANAPFVQTGSSANDSFVGFLGAPFSLDDYCGDVDGCRITLIRELGGTRFLYGPITFQIAGNQWWTFANGDAGSAAAGTSANGGALVILGNQTTPFCYLSDWESSGNINTGDQNGNFTVIRFNTTGIAQTCTIKVED